MAKKTTFRGSIALTALNHETILRNGQKGIFIPVEKNPAIYFKEKEDKTKVISLDIEVCPSPENKYGNSHYVRLSVGKENRQKYNLGNDAIREATPIVGNLKTFEYDDTARGGSKEDMPEFAQGATQAPEQFNDEW